MDPCWVNMCERDPTKDEELWVLVVSEMGTGDMGYERAKLTTSGWRFSAKPEYTKIVAWLESDRPLSRQEVSNVPKSGIRF
jgi:hypothetical protein